MKYTSFSHYIDAAIFYRDDLFHLLESGSIWLSPTPDVPFSEGFSKKQVAPRIWVWAQLRVVSTGQVLHW